MKADLYRDAVEEIQRCYPQIYLACHTKHIRASSTPHRLSAKDSSLLVHLSPRQPQTPGDLAAHMGVGASTLSAAIRRLEDLGYLRREKNVRDRRVVALTLTQQGSRAMAATSVLDGTRLAAVVALLTAEERKHAVEGIRLLAEASSRMALRSKMHAQLKRVQGKGTQGRKKG
jgi:MarR family transcriptional regulator, organic hydroperoxide resistance regulator